MIETLFLVMADSSTDSIKLSSPETHSTTQPKKIVITSNTSWYLFNFRRNTIKALIANGNHVTVVAPHDKYSNTFSDMGCEYKNIYIDQGGMNPFKDILTLLHFCKVFVQLRPDTVLNFTPKNNIYGTVAGKLTGAKVINNISGLGVIFTKTGTYSWVVEKLYKSALKFADKVFFQNEEDRSLFVSKSVVREELTERIPGSGVDLERFTYSLRKPDGKIKFLMISRMLKEKGVYEYIEAAKYVKSQYPDASEFYMLGFLDLNSPSANTKDEMDNWAERGIINYLGASDKVEDEIEKVDCIVLPSYYREGVPRSLLEGAAMGKPIITTDNVGCRETVDHGINGFLCDPKSSESLTEVFCNFIETPYEDRVKMGINSRNKIAEEFSEQIVIKKYLNVI